MNTGSRLQIAPDLQLVVQPITCCDLTSISILLGIAGDIVTNNDCPSFVQLLGHDQLLQMIYDNGTLSLDGDKGCGGFYEIETIIDEIAEWFADSDNVKNCVYRLSDSHEEMSVNINDDSLTAGQVHTLLESICHYIKTEINITDLPLCLVDCMYTS